MEFIKNNIWEIKKSNSLKLLGVILSLFQIVQFYFWYQNGDLPLKYAQEATPLCRSFFESCQWVRFLPFGVMEASYYAYAGLAAFAAMTFLLTHFTAFGFCMLVLSWLLGALLYFQDFRLSSNEGFLILFLTLSFFLVPSKNRYFRWIIVSFFAASGLAKISPDWLTGSWFLLHLPLPIKLGEWLGAVTLLIEMIAAATLLMRDVRFFLTGWLCLVALQIMMLYVGELAMPILNLALLFYIAVDELAVRKAEREYLYQSFIRPEPSFVLGGTLILLFWTAQLFPFLSGHHSSVNSSVGSALELLALHHLAAPEECHQVTYVVYRGRTEQISFDTDLSRSAVMRCNSYLRFLDLRSLCKRMKAEHSDFVTISSILEITSLRTQEVRRAFEIKDFCRDDLNFKKLSSVKWNSQVAN